MCHIETRRTKETVTPQLAKLLIYSLFNQINERVDAHFYAPVQLFMVYGNCPEQTRVHRSRPRPGPYGRSSCEARLPDDRPFFFRKELRSRARARAPFLSSLSLSSPSSCPLASSFSPSASDQSKRPYDCLINGVSQPQGITSL